MVLKRVCGFLIIFMIPLFGGRDSIMQEYLNFIQKNPRVFGQMGDYKRGEIEIVTDVKKIKEIEELQKVRFVNKGMSTKEAEAASKTGVVYQDPYWIWIRDAVIFPTGAEGTYDRLLQQSTFPGGIHGVAILPVFSDGRIGLVVSYRHATRCWLLELPRGHKAGEESNEITAIRELKEETGFIAEKVQYLGEIVPESGVLSSIVPVYLAEVKKQEMASPDYSEAIVAVELFTLAQIKEGFLKGWLEVEINGKKEKVRLSDGFLAYAILQAEYRKLL